MRLAPRSLTGQLALLILVAFLVAQFISLWLFTGERGTALQASLRVETAERAAAVVLALEAAEPENRPGILADIIFGKFGDLHNRMGSDL